MPGGISGLGGTKDKIAAFKTEDPREEILKYAKLAAEDPFFVAPAYAQTQPQVAAGAHLAKTVDSDDEEEKR
jgi:WD repeat-containing protein 70